MDNIIQSIELCLKTQNWNGALFLTLMIPDICAGLEFGSTNGKRYITWFEKYKDISYVGHMTGRDCYAFRCSFLHQGIMDVSHQRVQIDQKKQNTSVSVVDKFSFGTGGSHLISFRNVISESEDAGKNICHLDVKRFCEDMIGSVEKWCKDVEAIADVQKRIINLPKINNGAELYGGAILIDV